MPSDYPYRVESQDVFLPDERLDLPAALAGFTMGSAYVNHLDQETGSIEVGKQADVVVVDRNLFAHPVDEIASATCQMAFVAGELVYAAGDA
jgi:predicted amidohydrolase YtcJ